MVTNFNNNVFDEIKSIIGIYALTSYDYVEDSKTDNEKNGYKINYLKLINKNYNFINQNSQNSNFNLKDSALGIREVIRNYFSHTNEDNKKKYNKKKSNEDQLSDLFRKFYNEMKNLVNGEYKNEVFYYSEINNLIKFIDDNNLLQDYVDSVKSNYIYLYQSLLLLSCILFKNEYQNLLKDLDWHLFSLKNTKNLFKNSNDKIRRDFLNIWYFCDSMLKNFIIKNTEYNSWFPHYNGYALLKSKINFFDQLSCWDLINLFKSLYDTKLIDNSIDNNYKYNIICRKSVIKIINKNTEKNLELNFPNECYEVDKFKYSVSNEISKNTLYLYCLKKNQIGIRLNLNSWFEQKSNLELKQTIDNYYKDYRNARHLSLASDNEQCFKNRYVVTILFSKSQFSDLFKSIYFNWYKNKENIVQIINNFFSRLELIIIDKIKNCKNLKYLDKTNTIKNQNNKIVKTVSIKKLLLTFTYQLSNYAISDYLTNNKKSSLFFENKIFETFKKFNHIKNHESLNINLKNEIKQKILFEINNVFTLEDNNQISYELDNNADEKITFEKIRELFNKIFKNIFKISEVDKFLDKILSKKESKSVGQVCKLINEQQVLKLNLEPIFKILLKKLIKYFLKLLTLNKEKNENEGYSLKGNYKKYFYNEFANQDNESLKHKKELYGAIFIKFSKELNEKNLHEINVHFCLEKMFEALSECFNFPDSFKKEFINLESIWQISKLIKLKFLDLNLDRTNTNYLNCLIKISNIHNLTIGTNDLKELIKYKDNTINNLDWNIILKNLYELIFDQFVKKNKFKIDTNNNKEIKFIFNDDKITLTLIVELLEDNKLLWFNKIIDICTIFNLLIRFVKKIKDKETKDFYNEGTFKIKQQDLNRHLLYELIYDHNNVKLFKIKAIRSPKVIKDILCEWYKSNDLTESKLNRNLIFHNRIVDRTNK